MDFYLDPASTPCRAVLLVANTLGIELSLKALQKANNELEDENLKVEEQNDIIQEEIMENQEENIEGQEENKENQEENAENQQENKEDQEENKEERQDEASDNSKVPSSFFSPTLVDGDFILTDLKTIAMYLADQYSTDDTLYPEDPDIRARINQRLFFDETLYNHFINFFTPKLFRNITANPRMYSTIDASFEILDKFLNGEEYCAGDFLTIADLCLVTTVSTFEAIGVDIEKYPNVWKWYENVLEITPGNNIHRAGVEAFLASIQGDEE